MLERKYILLARRLRCSRRRHNEGVSLQCRIAAMLANLILLGVFNFSSVEQTQTLNAGEVKRSAALSRLVYQLSRVVNAQPQVNIECVECYTLRASFPFVVNNLWGASRSVPTLQFKRQANALERFLLAPHSGNRE